MRKFIKGDGLPCFLLALLVLLISFSTLTNLFTSLPDWRDHAYIVWVMSNNINHFLNLDFVNMFNLNGFYPNQGTLFLSDLLIPQSLIMLPFYVLTKNFIASFNLTLIVVLILNSISTYYFWKEIFNKRRLAFIASLLTSYSPFFHSNIYHFQMINFWPFFISAYFILRWHRNKLMAPLAGLFLAIQFIASAYLAVFLLVFMALYSITKTVKDRSISSIKSAFISLLVFVLIDGLFLLGYALTRKEFGVNTSYHEYVAYSSHLLDYIFSRDINSALHTISLIENWNRFAKHSGITPGLFMILLGVLPLVFVQVKEKIQVGFRIEKSDVFFVLLMAFGFLASLGPRLQVNGTFDQIPLPYHFVVKYVPFLDAIRAPSRWSMFVYLGLTYLAVGFVGRLKHNLVYGFIVVFILFEYLPLGIPSEVGGYIKPKDDVLKSMCQENKKVVLEIPVTHFDAGKNSILEGLTYITTTLLATTYHNCVLVNGYSGFDLPSIQLIKDNVYKAFVEEDETLLFNTLLATRAEVVVVNKESVVPELESKITPLLDKMVKIGYLVPEESDVFTVRVAK